jgi:hypothetical protein
MTSTRIIAADGTRYTPQGAGKRLAKRIAAGIAIFVLLIITSAAVIGFSRAPAATNETDTFNDGWNTGISDLQEIAKKVGKVKAANCLSATDTPDDLYACLTR